MSYGLDLGYLKTSSMGMSYVDSFTYSGGGLNKTYESPSFEFATSASCVIMPAENVPPNKIPAFPSVSAAVNNAEKKIAVRVTGGNVSVNILVFVR